MSFQSYIQNLRNKPEHNKRRYQLLVAAGITLVVAFFWVFSFSNEVGVIAGNSDYEKPSPFKVLADSFRGVFADIGRGVEVTKDKVTNSEETAVVEDGADLIYIKE